MPLFDGWGIAFIAVTLLVGLVLHEFMHAATATAFGDPTARKAGRLSLNPIRHIDPFGTIILPGILLFLAATGMGSGAVFGYAKPVPVRIDRLRRPRLQSLLVSLAGPATNLVLGFLGALALRLQAGAPDIRVLQFLILWILINLIIGAFNVLPVPPLDGSEIVAALLPGRWRPAWYGLVRQFGFILLLAVFLLLPTAFDAVLSPVLGFLLRLAGLGELSS
ncbi:MAG TPA: site-2 protease family protein [Actinomycetota bacterium]|nr:site-2 protease family protein [Actinomycetota bacterium]